MTSKRKRRFRNLPEGLDQVDKELAGIVFEAFRMGMDGNCTGAEALEILRPHIMALRGTISDAARDGFDELFDHATEEVIAQLMEKFDG